jgi:hypothetical protein
MKFDERNQQIFPIPPFFISMATAAKFVLLIPETAKMLKKLKNTKIIIAGYSPNRN